ncbi:fatty-acyl-CoA synthase [Enhydrobacter aerosaccus]|uniref:Fatty-acyl-CoA synthase n=1 Tax=Enhydrobacter aerosaccus TaxID=225324 RepID=A0A1T4NSI6_9HYPH|nr:long-chain-fatty-acid--CoA ligase [Enhydrobacter aerosaccus]SJZ82270.1 fatty-acyl-CoA synthase [Enhydrobacter aerosaccus]
MGRPASDSRTDFWPAGVPRHLGPLPRSLGEALRLTAARRGEALAIAYYGAEITFADLLGRVERLAAFLQHRCGVRQGDRVLLGMQNSPHFVIGYQAIVRAGAVVVPVNPMNTPDELGYFATDSGARTAIIGAELLDRYASLVPAPLEHLVIATYGDEIPADTPFRLPSVIAESVLPAPLPVGAIAWEEALAESAPPLPDRTEPGDLCVMPYTSGTTGKPKACKHTHASVLHTALLQASWYGYDDDTVLTGFMPMFHVAGMQLSLNGCAAAGASLVIMSRWDRDLVGPLFERYGVTLWSAAPTMVIDVLSGAGLEDKAFARLKIITGGGATMPEAVAAELERRFGLHFIEGYGMTETISPTHLNPLDRPKAQCLGIPVHDTVARVVSPETFDELPRGEVGEIVVAGPQIMQGYWNRPDADAETFLERDRLRFLRTGDLGWVDEDGYFHIIDRLKRMVNVSGYKVWPAECEATLHRHPAIQECCLVSSPDPYRGETVKLFVVRRPGIETSADDIIAWARGVMAAYKVPRRVEFVDHLPRSASNKVDWRSLQAAEWERAKAAASTAA